MMSLAIFAGYLVMLLPTAMLRAWALQTLWNWYLPIVLGAPEMTFSGAFGVSLITAFLTYQHRHEDINSDEERIARFLSALLVGIIWPPVSVFCGWVFLSIWPVSP